MDRSSPSLAAALVPLEPPWKGRASLVRNAALAAIGLPLVVLALVALQPWVPPHELLRDPLATVSERSSCCGLHLGVVSHLGVALWTAAAAICAFAAFGVRSGLARSFLLGAALLSAWLGVDDLLMLHEEVLPALGMPELATYALYGMAGLLHLATALRVTAMDKATAGTRALLLIAILMLGASVAMDTVLEAVGWNVSLGLEDGAKLIGIANWLAFHAVLARSLLFDRSPEGAPG